MSIVLKHSKLISNLEYLDLVDPQFEGQTIVNEEGYYYMVFSSEGVFYSTKHSLIDHEEYDECIGGEFSV